MYIGTHIYVYIYMYMYVYVGVLFFNIGSVSPYNNGYAKA